MRHKILVGPVVKFLVLYCILRTLEYIVRGTLSGNEDSHGNSQIQSDIKSERKIDPGDQIKIIAVHYLGKAYSIPCSFITKMARVSTRDSP